MKSDAPQGRPLGRAYFARLAGGLALMISFCLFFLLHSPFLFHTIVELCSTMLITSAFLFFFNQESPPQGFILLLTTGLFFSSLFDLAHLFTSTDFDLIKLPDLANKSVQTWLTARFILITTLFIALFAHPRPIRPFPVFVSFACLSLILFTSIFIFDFLPQVYTSQKGLTVIAFAASWSLFALLLIYLWLLVTEHPSLSPQLLRFITSALVLTLVASFLQTIHWEQNTGINSLGHLFKLSASYLFYGALVILPRERAIPLFLDSDKNPDFSLEPLPPPLSTEANSKGSGPAQQGDWMPKKYLHSLNHSFRSALSGVLIWSEILAEKTKDPETQEGAKAIRAATHKMVHSLELVNELSQLNDPEQDEVSINFKLVDLLQRCKKNYASAAQAKGIQLKFQLDALEPLVFFGPFKPLSKLVNHLISNAIQLNHGGEVCLRALVEEKTEPNSSQFIRIEITNQGSQVIQDPLNKASTPYETNLDQEEMALPLIKKWVARLSGNYGMQPQKRGGRLVWFEFSLLPEQADYQSLQTSTSIQEAFPSPRLILLVDDEETSRNLLARMLKKIGHKVQLASNGEEALRRCKALAFDLIIMDCVMPRMNGLETVRLLRKQEDDAGQARVPVIALTSLIKEEDSNLCIEAGMNGYMAKPIEFLALKEVVASYLAAT